LTGQIESRPSNKMDAKKIIKKYLLAECEYERMQFMNEDYEDETYDEFMAWNLQCIEDLSEKSLAWITQLCVMIGSGDITTMDMEDCHEWRASGMYFNRHSNICIFHPR